VTAIPDPFANMRAALQRQAAQTAALREAVDKATAPGREAAARMQEALAPMCAHLEEVTRPMREVVQRMDVMIGAPAAGAVAQGGEAVARVVRNVRAAARRAVLEVRRVTRAALARLGQEYRPVVVAVIAPPRERARPPGQQTPALSLVPSLSHAAHAPPARAVVPFRMAVRVA
jgi:hypothetical protein